MDGRRMRADAEGDLRANRKIGYNCGAWVDCRGSRRVSSAQAKWTTTICDLGIVES
jgi:hypothetical protein